jgi:hypothetical protein
MAAAVAVAVAVAVAEVPIIMSAQPSTVPSLGADRML